MPQSPDLPSACGNEIRASSLLSNHSVRIVLYIIIGYSLLAWSNEPCVGCWKAAPEYFHGPVTSIPWSECQPINPQRTSSPTHSNPLFSHSLFSPLPVYPLFYPTVYIFAKATGNRLEEREETVRKRRVLYIKGTWLQSIYMQQPGIQQGPLWAKRCWNLIYSGYSVV